MVGVQFDDKFVLLLLLLLLLFAGGKSGNSLSGVIVGNSDRGGGFGCGVGCRRVGIGDGEDSLSGNIGYGWYEIISIWASGVGFGGDAGDGGGDIAYLICGVFCGID